MARFIIDNKVYDTDKMDFIGSAKKWYEFTYWFQQQAFGKGVGLYYDCSIYKSSNGNWLLTHKQNGKLYGEAITENEARTLLLDYDYEAYAIEFGELEEA